MAKKLILLFGILLDKKNIDLLSLNPFFMTQYLMNLKNGAVFVFDLNN